MSPLVKKQQGFTLIEVIISVAILAVITAMAATTIAQFSKYRERVELAQTRVSQLQTFFLLIERDLNFVIARPVNLGGRQEDLYAGFELYSGEGNIEGEIMQFSTSFPSAGSDIQSIERVSWQKVDDSIYRSTWRYLDRERSNFEIGENDETAYRQRVLTGVRNLDVSIYPQFIDDSAENKFNNQNFDDPGDLQLYRVPRIFEVDLEMQDRNHYKRLFDAPFQYGR